MIMGQLYYHTNLDMDELEPTCATKTMDWIQYLDHTLIVREHKMTINWCLMHPNGHKFVF